MTRSPNPNGRGGRPINIPLDFEDAIRAALETPPEPKKEQPRREKKLEHQPTKRYDQKK